MPRFYCPQPLPLGATIALPDPVAHHAWVVRLQPGAELMPVQRRRRRIPGRAGHARQEGRDRAHRRAGRTRLRAAVRNHAGAGACRKRPRWTGSSRRRSNWGWRRSSRWRRSAAWCGWPASAPKSAHAHWQAVIVAASEQSGRNRLARLAPLDNFSGWIAQSGLHKRVLLTPRASEPLAGWARHQPPQALTLMVGPEGGFSARKKMRPSRTAPLRCRWGRACCAPRRRRWPRWRCWRQSGAPTETTRRPCRLRT